MRKIVSSLRNLLRTLHASVFLSVVTSVLKPDTREGLEGDKVRT